MTDDVSMIFFTVDPEVKDHYYRAPRRSRQMFFYKDQTLFQSRLYPSDLSEQMDLYRSIVQKAIAACLGVPNRWVLKKKREDVKECCTSGEGSRQYPDYNYYGNRTQSFRHRRTVILCLLRSSIPFGSFEMPM